MKHREALSVICSRGIRSGWTPSEIYRLTVAGLPRDHHRASAVERERMREAEPEATGTRWDELVAAMVEHLSLMDGARPPAWTQESWRFANEPMTPPGGGGATRLVERLATTPGPFLRHGIPIDVRDLDDRGGGAEIRNAGGTDGLGNDETEWLLELERRLKVVGKRGHVYGTRNGQIVLAATAESTWRTLDPGWEGPGPLVEAINEMERAGARTPEWESMLPRRENIPPPTAWSTRNLIVTGVANGHAAAIMEQRRTRETATSG